jgi:hypothetical protein
MQPASALNLGSVVKNDMAYASGDGLAKFTILFWTRDDAGCTVSLKVDSAPENWDVILQPDIFMVSTSSNGELVYLQDETLGAFPVTVLVKPNGASDGRYSIMLSASVTPGVSQSGGTSGVGVLQKRAFRLTVDYNETGASGGPAAIPTSVIAATQAAGDGSPSVENISGWSEEAENDKADTGFLVAVYQNMSYLFLAAGVFCILVVSLIIYKYA